MIYDFAIFQERYKMIFSFDWGCVNDWPVAILGLDLPLQKWAKLWFLQLFSRMAPFGDEFAKLLVSLRIKKLFRIGCFESGLVTVAENKGAFIIDDARQPSTIFFLQSPLASIWATEKVNVSY